VLTDTVLARVIGVYRDNFKDRECAYVREFPKETELASSWYVKMKSGGHLTTHIHEEGWVSGAIYLSLRQNKAHPNEGSIEVSTHGDDYPKLHDHFAPGPSPRRSAIRRCSHPRCSTAPSPSARMSSASASPSI